MAVVKLYDLARMTTATLGPGTITLGVAVSPYLSFSAAGVQNGDTVRYAIYDPTVGGSEIGVGVYTASGTTLTRGPTSSTNNNAAISLSGQAQVFITAGANDFFVGQGIGLYTAVPIAYPGAGPPNIAAGIASGHIIAPLDSNPCWTGNGVYPFQIIASNQYVAGNTATIGSHTNGQTFTLVFSSSAIIGSPITITFTAGAGATNATVAAGLAALVNANASLFGSIGYPLFCQANGTIINIQWSVLDTVTLATTGSTGTITLGSSITTLDYAVSILGRFIPGYIGQNGDAIHCLQFMGQSVSGSLDLVTSQICSTIIDATARTGNLTVSTTVSGVLLPQIGIQSGLVLFDGTGALPTGGYLSPGYLNVPATGGLAVAQQIFADNAGIYAINNTIFGNRSSASGVLVLQDNNQLSSTGNVSIKAANKQGYEFDGTTSTFGVAGSVIGSLALANATSGVLTLKPATGALSGVLTLPNVTDTLVGSQATQTLIHKTIAFASNTLTGVAPLATPIFTTNITSPIVYGGSGTTSTVGIFGTSNGSPAAGASVQLSSATTNAGVFVDYQGHIGLNTTSPVTQFHVHIAPNQNSIWESGPNGDVADGVMIVSLNDAASTFLSMEFQASTLYLRGNTAIDFNFNGSLVGQFKNGFSVGSTNDPGSGNICLSVHTVTTLPTAASTNKGAVALVSDATSNILIGAGGGTAYALVASTGSAWVAV